MSTFLPIMTTGNLIKELSLECGYITRVATFCASHRLRKDEWDDGKNAAVFGKCSNRNGHGHDYKVEIKFKGPIEPDTGMIINTDVLKKWMEQVLYKELDHKDLDKDVPYFQNILSTTENLGIFIWKQLKALMGPECGFSLEKVKISKMDGNIFTYMGEKA